MTFLRSWFQIQIFWVIELRGMISLFSPLPGRHGTIQFRVTESVAVWKWAHSIFSIFSTDNICIATLPQIQIWCFQCYFDKFQAKLILRKELNVRYPISRNVTPRLAGVTVSHVSHSWEEQGPYVPHAWPAQAAGDHSINQQSFQSQPGEENARSAPCLGGDWSC